MNRPLYKYYYKTYRRNNWLTSDKYKASKKLWRKIAIYLRNRERYKWPQIRL